MKKLALIDMGSIRGLSVRHLSSYVKTKGVTCKILFPRIQTTGFDSLPRLSDKQKENVLEYLNSSGTTHIGFYLMTGHFNAFKSIVSFLRERGWGGVIIAGGVHPTICPLETLFEGVDYVVIGPGEDPLMDIINNSDHAGISGLVYRTNGEVKQNPVLDEAYIEIDNLPFPDYDFHDHYYIDDKISVMDRNMYNKFSTWGGTYYFLTTSRGCPYRCAYCSNVNRMHLSRASVRHAIDEIKFARKAFPDMNGVNIQDDSFFMGNDQWIEDFCKTYRKEIGLPLIARIMPKFATRKRLKILKGAGLKYVSIGLQGSERLNREIYLRRETNETFLNACAMMNELGMTFLVDVILDNVYETEDDLKEISRTLNKLPRPFKVLAYGMTVFPGTDFSKRVKADNLQDKFATDPYESMFRPTKPGGYSTLFYWRSLIKNIIPLNKDRRMMEELIEKGPSDEKSAKIVERLFRQAEFKMKVMEKLRSKLPWVFDRIMTLIALMRKYRKVQ